MTELKPEYITIDDDEKERARLAAHWLQSALAQTPYEPATIRWEEKGFQADVRLRTRGAPVIDGYWNYQLVGDLLSVYSHMRSGENFVAWLRAAMGDNRTFLDDGAVQLPRNERIEYFLETLPSGIQHAAQHMRSNEDGLLYPHTAVRMWREYPSQTEDGREIVGGGSHWECVGFVQGRGWLGEVLARATDQHYETWSLFPFNAARGPHILDHDPKLSDCLHGKPGRYTEITEADIREFAHAFTLDYFQIHPTNTRYVEVLECAHHDDHHANWYAWVKFSAKGDKVKLLIHPTGSQGLEVFATQYEGIND